MKRKKLIIAVGLISILLLLISTGCSPDSLKSSQNTPREEPPEEEVTTTDEEGSADEEAAADEESAAGEETSSDEEESSEDEAGTGDEVEAEPTENPDTNCSSLNPHPLAEGITEQFDVTYDQVMTWYCDGAAFSDIMLALETVELADISVEELLSMLDENTWDEIWQELGVEK